MLIYTIRDIIGLTIAALLLLTFALLWLLVRFDDWRSKRRWEAFRRKHSQHPTQPPSPASTNQRPGE